jgi:hypothetical protein
VANEVEKRKSQASDLPQDAEPAAAALQEIGNSPEPIRTRRTSLQKNVQWRNKNTERKTGEERYQLAIKAATKIFHQKKLDPSSERRSQQAIIDDLNEEYRLTGVNKENSWEKNMLSLATVKRYVSQGLIDTTPLKKGKTPEISRNWMKLVAVHINMCQVLTVGESDIGTIKATMAASLIGTEWEGEFKMEYAWETIWHEHAETLVPAGHRAADDIRWHWVTHGKIEQFFDDIKVCLLHLFVHQFH